MYRVSSLGRPLDPRYKSNLQVIAVSTVAALIVAALQQFVGLSLGITPFTAAMSVFLAWAIGRELDPDRSVVASLAMAIAFAAAFIGPADLLLGAGVLVGTRAVSGTVGASLRGLDVLALIGLAALLGAGGIAIAAVPGLLAAAIVGTGSRKQGWLAASGVALAAGVGLLVARPVVTWEIGSGVGVAMLALVLVALVVSPPIGPITAPADLGGPLSSRRITWARLVAVSAVVAGFLLGGGVGVMAAFPTAGAAVAAASVISLTNQSGNRRRTGIEETAVYG